VVRIQRQMMWDHGVDLGVSDVMWMGYFAEKDFCRHK
jgi:hypothetical protein